MERPATRWWVSHDCYYQFLLLICLVPCPGVGDRAGNYYWFSKQNNDDSKVIMFTHCVHSAKETSDCRALVPRDLFWVLQFSSLLNLLMDIFIQVIFLWAPKSNYERLAVKWAWKMCISTGSPPCVQLLQIPWIKTFVSNLVKIKTKWRVWKKPT